MITTENNFSEEMDAPTMDKDVNLNKADFVAAYLAVEWNVGKVFDKDGDKSGI